ncbi:hypothetical protein NUW58_g803 [Xylaria curta]|uniref:Uncharacterized protein n=1 Tax=Xylaria curta TaxID=42375 RepID=A0ACC1PQS3_9PEZI|nr:hypothetical protein NUW58_g803 [Xylaria curta]
MESNKNPRNITVIFVLGPPGSGKGTLCKLATYKVPSIYCHLSVGDYLREISNPKTYSEASSFDHKQIRSYLHAGKLLPAEILIPALKHKIDSTSNGRDAPTTWLIDGFPRNMENVLAFEEKIGKPVKVITLECGRDVAEERFVSRGREETDDAKRFDKRYNEYVENMKAILQYYGGIVEFIHADGNREGCQEEFMAMLVRLRGD